MPPRRSFARLLLSCVLVSSASLAGTSLVRAADCNGNGVDDASDVESGTSDDCNLDGVPDECEVAALRFGATDAVVPLDQRARVLRSVDVDGDGDMDLVTGNRQSRQLSTVSVLRNRGDGTFESAAYSAAIDDETDSLYALEILDLDGDGDPDLVSANEAALLLLFNEDGRGEFSPPVSVPLPVESRIIASGDVDGDGHKDVAVAHRGGGAVTILRSDGAGGLSPAGELELPEEARSLRLADFDGDGRTDLASAGRSADGIFFLGDGAGGFGPAATVSLGARSAELAIAADLNADGRADLVARTSRSLFVVFAGDEGGFAPPVAIPGVPRSALAADADVDGDFDLVIGQIGKVTVRTNDGAGRFGISFDSVLPTNPIALAAGDFDGDHVPDLALAAVAGSTSEVIVLRGGAESAASVVSDPVPLTGCADPRGCRPHSGTSGDFDGDGKLEVLASITHPGSFAITTTKSGDLEFEGIHVFGGEHPQSVAAGDIDGDGDTDAVTVDNLDHNLYVHVNDGSGSFGRSPSRYRVGNAPINVALFDIDGDGALDAASADESGGTVTVLFSDGAGDFSDGKQTLRVGGNPKAVAAGDLDGDGDGDVAVAIPSRGRVSVLLNIGERRFGEESSYQTSGQPNHVTMGDFDGDGDLDLATANSSQTSSIFLNAGDGTFGEATQVAIGQRPYSVMAVDFDGDGWLDLVTGNEASSNVSILPGRGDGTFDAPTHVEGGNGLRFVAPGDWDEDGDLDLATIDREGHSITILRNESPASLPDYLERLCTPREYELLSARSTTRGGADRFLKFTIAADDDDALLPAAFQNTDRYELHLDFLEQVFPERFGGLTPAEYAQLVEKRSTRRYFAGVVSRIRRPTGTLYGFSVVADFGDPVERLDAAEMKDVYERLRRHVHLEPLAYAPATRDAIAVAEGWEDPGFPVELGDADAGLAYESYTSGIAYGRVRVLDGDAFDEANESGRLSARDILVLERAPRDIEGVVGGVITAERQSDDFSHLRVRTARRGTPNAYVRDALERFTESELVRLEVNATGFDVTPVSADEVARWHEANRRELSEPPRVDREFDELLTLAEIAELDGAAGAPPSEARFGGKASHLARLQETLTGEFERYRRSGFAIPIAHYFEFLSSNTIPSLGDPDTEVTYAEYLEELRGSDEFVSDSARRFELLAAFREHIEDHGEVSAALVRRVALKVAAVFGSASTPIRLRSSSNLEDALEFNGAGLYDSTSACAADDLDADSGGPSRCDAARTEERGIARGLKRVWGSLWNFRAYEERAFYGVDETEVAMAVLVTGAFTDERANGVAFTGDPSGADDRFVIVAQVGENSVVSPEPGVAAERSLLEVVDGEVVSIVRARASSLVENGESVLDDDALRELGTVLWHLAETYPVDLGGHAQSDVLLDVEFKLDADGKVALKQVRPFLRTQSSQPEPVFELVIPPGTLACGKFDIARDLREEYRHQSVLRFVPGRVALAAGAERFAASIVEDIEFGPERQLATPSGPGEFTVTKSRTVDGDDRYRFDYEQEFALADDSRAKLEIFGLEFFARDGIAFELSRTVDDELLTDALAAELTPADGGNFTRIEYSSCAYGQLPLWIVHAEIADGTVLRLEERFRREPEEETGPAALVRADVEFGETVGGGAQTITDYWKLVYTAVRHNREVNYLVLLETPVELAGLDAPVHAIELVPPDPFHEVDVGARYLGAGLELLTRAELVEFDRSPADDPENRPFRRGDATGNGSLEVSDALAVLRYLFARGDVPGCLKAIDANDDGRLNVTDAVKILLRLFGEDEGLPEPFDRCGLDPTPDELGCESSGACA